MIWNNKHKNSRVNKRHQQRKSKTSFVREHNDVLARGAEIDMLLSMNRDMNIFARHRHWHRRIAISFCRRSCNPSRDISIENSTDHRQNSKAIVFAGMDVWATLRHVIYIYIMYSICRRRFHSRWYDEWWVCFQSTWFMVAIEVPSSLVINGILLVELLESGACRQDSYSWPCLSTDIIHGRWVRRGFERIDLYSISRSIQHRANFSCTLQWMRRCIISRWSLPYRVYSCTVNVGKLTLPS